MQTPSRQPAKLGAPKQEHILKIIWFQNHPEKRNKVPLLDMLTFMLQFGAVLILN